MGARIFHILVPPFRRAPLSFVLVSPPVPRTLHRKVPHAPHANLTLAAWAITLVSRPSFHFVWEAPTHTKTTAWKSESCSEYPAYGREVSVHTRSLLAAGLLGCLLAACLLHGRRRAAVHG